MSTLPKSIQNLINELAKLPGIGPKTASRLAFYLLKQPRMEIEIFAQALSNLQKNIIFCGVCYNMSETDPCGICLDTKRNHNLICVVEDALDVQAMDQIRGFSGVYHVLGGVISPLDGIGPDKLKITELFKRLSGPPPSATGGGGSQEIILATNPTLEGEATAMYIAKQLKQPEFKHVKITRLARGLPQGADLEYADESTLSKALDGRQEF